MTTSRHHVAARRTATNIGRIAIVAGALGLLASCGGGDDNGTPPPVTPPVVVSNTPPASASESVLGFIAFLKTLVPTMPETTQPLDVTNFVAPTTETDQPDPSV